MSRNLCDKFPAVTFLLKRCVMVSIAIFMSLFLLGADVAHAQTATVGELAKISENQQLEVVTTLINKVLVILTSHTGLNGKPKSAEEFTNDRISANLIRALFIQDPKDLKHTPEGPRVMLLRIKKYAKEAPDRTINDVTSDLVDWCLQKFYYSETPEKKAVFAKKSDADQVAWFKIYIQMYENERLYQQTMRELKQKDDQLTKEIREMYDNAVVLADGRHIMPDKKFDNFFVISSNSDDKNNYKLEKRFYPEAKYLYRCLESHGLSGGQKNSDYCRSIR